MTPSEEIQDATGEGPVRENVIELLNEKRAALASARERYATARAMRDEISMGDLARQIDALLILIPELEQDAQVVCEVAGRKAAEDRLTAIKRAYGSTVASYQQDEARVVTATAALRDAITVLNQRAKKLEDLRAEAAALSDRFGLPVPSLSIVNEPREDIAASLPPFWRHQVVRPSFEDDEHRLRQRRDYQEVGGSPGYGIIQRAGFRPFRPLTEREREVLDGMAEERKPDATLQQAAAEVVALGALRMAGGHVHRG